MSRKQNEEAQARIRHLEQVNEALLQANEQLKDRAAPLDAQPFIWQRDKARAELAAVREEKNQLARKLRGLLDRSSRENADDFSQRQELFTAQRERDAAQARVLYLETQLAMADAMRNYRRFSIFSHDVWRRLVQLCHPDKHNGSKASTEATRWLMENRP
jgi:hypothetical protein